MTPEEKLMVRPIDKEKLEKYFTEIFPVKENQRCRTQLFALVAENVMTDNECCYWFLDKKLHKDKVQYVDNIPVGLITKTKDGESYSMTPAYYYDMSIEELEPYFLTEVSLKEFMKGRFNYNPRIVRNTKDFMDAVGKHVLSAKVGGV